MYKCFKKLSESSSKNETFESQFQDFRPDKPPQKQEELFEIAKLVFQNKSQAEISNILQKYDIDDDLKELNKLKTSLLSQFDLERDRVCHQVQQILEKIRAELEKTLDETFENTRLDRMKEHVMVKRYDFLKAPRKKQTTKFVSSLYSVKYINSFSKRLQQRFKSSADAFVSQMEKQASRMFLEDVKTKITVNLLDIPQKLFANCENMALFQRVLQSIRDMDSANGRVFTNTSDCFQVESEGTMDQAQFKRMCKNQECGAILFKYIDIQAKIGGLTEKMCQFIQRRVFPERRILFNCLLDSNACENPFYYKMERIQKLGRESVFLCRTSSENLFGGYFARPFESKNQKNLIFSLSKQTVHPIKANHDSDLDFILQNLTTDFTHKSADPQRRAKCLLRMGEVDVVIFETKDGRLVGKSKLGEMFQNPGRQDSHLAGNNMFKVTQWLIFEVYSIKSV